MNILAYYCEPMCLKRQTRLFVFLGAKVSIYDIAPGFRRAADTTATAAMPVSPMVIDMSL